jgi:hypothetical protein
MARPPTVVVTAAELRQKFRDLDFLGRLQRGELTERLIKDRQPNPPPFGMPAGTRSQIIAYVDAGRQVAIVHQYLLPNGQIGGSGLPDPKRLLIDGLLHIVV